MFISAEEDLSDNEKQQRGILIFIQLVVVAESFSRLFSFPAIIAC